MEHNEFEQHKRVLDDQLRAAIDLLKAGHAAQMRELEARWQVAETGAAASESPSGSTPESPPDPEPAAPAQVRQPAGSLYDAVLSVFAELPEEFDKNDILRALGYSPNRVSLFRVLRTLGQEGWIENKTFGAGRTVSVYRKKHDGADPPEG
jgi:hypothetical protein